MKLVDGELEYDLPLGRMAERPQGSVKEVEHSYEFTDYNARTRMGRGPTKIVVTGVATTAELDALDSASMADALYTFYYPDPPQSEDNRYYQRVSVMPVQAQRIEPGRYAYTIEMHALDGHAYDADTGARVT